MKLSYRHTFIMKAKQNISNQTNDTENLPPVLEKLRQESSGFKVPDGYFETLSPRIVDEINKRKNNSILTSILLLFRKPLVWSPVAAIAVVAVMLIFMIPAKKEPAVLVVDEWTELNMAFDASYAEEVMLAESIIVDSELEKTDLTYLETASFSTLDEPTDEEITKFLEEQETDTDILNEN